MFRDIIPITDDYRVAKGKAEIAVRTVQWCHEVPYFLHRIHAIDEKGHVSSRSPAPRLIDND